MPPILVTWVWSLKPMYWRTTNPHKLSSAFHMCFMSHIHVHMIKKMFKIQVFLKKKHILCNIPNTLLSHAYQKAWINVFKALSNNSFIPDFIIRIKIQTFSAYIHAGVELSNRAFNWKYSWQVFMMRKSRSNDKERCYISSNNYNESIWTIYGSFS